MSSLSAASDRLDKTRCKSFDLFFISGMVEEKIIKCADRKLLLDVAVIQQGRLAKQHSKLSKDEWMHMVSCGSDNFSTDEDIFAQIA